MILIRYTHCTLERDCTPSSTLEPHSFPTSWASDYSNTTRNNVTAQTALMIACIGGHSPLVDLLLECSADLNVKSEVSAPTCALSLTRALPPLRAPVISHSSQLTFEISDMPSSSVA